MKYYGALEAGGTKMVLSVMDETGNVRKQTRLPTKTPEETMPEMLAFFSAQPISALGIGGFGPLNLDRRSPRYGSIMETPKLAWRNFPLMQAFRDHLHVPVGLDTDVNAAALAEACLGAAKGKENCIGCQKTVLSQWMFAYFLILEPISSATAILIRSGMINGMTHQPSTTASETGPFPLV